MVGMSAKNEEAEWRRPYEKLGYQVNGLARGMRTQRTGYVVVMLPNITNPFYNMLLRDLEKALTGIGKQLVLCISDGDHKKEIKYIEMAKYNKVDGVIGVTFSNVEKYIEDSSAYVSIERCLPGVPCVSCDNYGGGWMAADSLIRRGAKNLLFFQTIGSVENEVRKRRYGFEACCEAENDVAYGSVSFFRTSPGTKYLLVLFCKKSDQQRAACTYGKSWKRSAAGRDFCRN